MPHHKTIAAVVLACATLGLPAGAAAASLSPLDGMTGPDAVPPGLETFIDPGAGTTPSGAGAIMTGPAATGSAIDGPQPFKFETDSGLDPNPLRDVLPDNQWARPRAAQDGRIRRR